MRYRILIVEDDRGIAEAVCAQAALWGWDCRAAQELRDIMPEFVEFAPHLVLLDISLPFYSGFHWCAEIRRLSHVPVIFLSSASDNMNIVMAMNLGADDFIAKPFDGNVLIAKMQAVLRRSYDFAPSSPLLEHRGAILDTGDASLHIGEEKLELTRNEYKILLTLFQNKGKVVSREKLMEQLWQSDSFVDDNTLTVNVNRLRRKLEAAGLEDYILTRFGVGYQIG